jgi:primosomal protein N' (replication factor Y)
LPYAEVAVNSPIGKRRAFSYAIPSHLSVLAGQAVLVPFGSKTLQGIVLSLSDKPSVEQVRDITTVIDPNPLLSKNDLRLADWLSRYYLCPIFDAVALMLPPGFERRAITFLSISPGVDTKSALTQLQEDQLKVFKLVLKEDKPEMKQLEKALGQKKAQAAVTALVRKNLLVRQYDLGRERIKPRTERYIKLLATPEEALSLTKRAPRQTDLVQYLAERGKAVRASLAIEESGVSAAALNSLTAKGLIIVEEKEVKRLPFASEDITLSYPLKLTPAQQQAREGISSALKENKSAVFLLHGVTCSGKTEIYLNATAQALKLKKQIIVLVPEIALTPQTIERFASRFPTRVAVLHSKLSLGEQYDQWHQIKNGDYDIVIGPRSAVFAPLSNIGLIIIDEEHEWSYKQQGKSPRYHARRTALARAKLSNATVVLGSATPDVESYYLAQKGYYRLLELPHRITPRADSSLPAIMLVDMRKELKEGNRSIFSRALSQAIQSVIAKKEQVILFYNRRGAASLVQCRDCGLVINCRHCNLPLTQHPAENSLLCHHCGFRTAITKNCPQCGGAKIKFTGQGTQSLEEEVAATFPTASYLRWDSDTTRQKNAHHNIMKDIKSGRTDIIIGTQMVAKGLDIPQVTLVGVINADTALTLPDFRASERTFQLLSQVAGRAGRGILGGKVIIQTYLPDNYAIQAATAHSYTSFYNKEVKYRLQLGNPPFKQLATLTISHTNNTRCQHLAEELKRQLILERDVQGRIKLEILGAIPTFIHRLRGKYRWQIILRGANISSFLENADIPEGWIVDIDSLGI